MMDVKVDELERRLNEVKNLEYRLQSQYMQRGYICGLINGLRLARGVISGDDYILEREDSQVPDDKSSVIVMPKCDEMTGKEKGFVIMKFDRQGGLIKLDHLK